jgi:hypothetical protein
VRRLERLALVLTVPAPGAPVPSIHLVASPEKGAFRTRVELLQPPLDTRELAPDSLLLVQAAAKVPEKELDTRPAFQLGIKAKAAASGRDENIVLPCRDAWLPGWLRRLLGLWWIGAWTR